MPRTGFYNHKSISDNITHKGRATLWSANGETNTAGIIRTWGPTVPAGLGNYVAGTWAEIIRTYDRREAANIPLGSGDGGTTSLRGLMAAIRERYPDISWKAGHILNADLGGIDAAQNLFPISAADNKWHQSCDNVAKNLLYWANGLLAVNCELVQKVAYRVHVTNPVANDYGFACSLGIKARRTINTEPKWLTVQDVENRYNDLFLQKRIPRGHDVILLDGDQRLLT